MSKAGKTHDITIETVGSPSSRRGFMLARGNRRVRGHRVRDAQTIQPRQLTMGELTEAESPPDIALYWSQEDWSLGIGGVNHRTDPRKLADSFAIDTSDERIRSARVTKEKSNYDMCPTEVRPTGFARVGTEVWAFVGRDVYERVISGCNDWTQGTAPDACTAQIFRNGVEFDGVTVAPALDPTDNSPNNYIFKADSDCDWTQHAGANIEADYKYFAVGRNAAGEQILWAGNRTGFPHIVRRSTDPTTDTTATWTNDIEVGQSDSEITALVPDGDTLLVCKTDGIYAVDTSDNYRNITPEFNHMAHADNFRNAFNWNGHILLPLGAGGMVELVGGELVNVSFEEYFPELTSLHRRNVVGIAGDPTTLFVLLHTGGVEADLFMAKWVEFQQHRDFRWHRVGRIATTGGITDSVNHCALFADGTPEAALIVHRVWLGVDGIDEDVSPHFFPLSDNDNDKAFSINSNQVAQTVEYDGNFPRIDKTFQQVDFEVNNLGAEGRAIDVEYRLDKGAWTSLGTLNTTGSNQTLEFNDGTDGKILELRFKPTQNAEDADDAPEIIQFRAVCQLRPTRIELLPMRLYLADNMTLLNGATAGSVKGDLSQLRTWAGQADEVIVVDSEENSRDMVVLPGSVRVEEVGHEFGRRSEFVVALTLAEVE